MRCGFYETEITPPLGCSMFGYATKRTAQGVKSKLYAKAAVLEQDGRYAAMLVVDATRIPKGMPEVVRRRVVEKTGIDENAILIAATHSHTSMPVQQGTAPEQDPELDQVAMDMAALLAADAVILAYQRLQPVNVRFGIGQAEGISFVREYHIKDGTIRTNPGYCMEDVVKPYSDPDTDLPAFFFTDAEGKPVGAITSFALHHDTVSGSEISADFSGYVAQNLKRTFGDQFITLFFAGFCGNINHLNYCGEPFKHTAQEIADVLTKELLATISKAEPIGGDSLAVKMETIKIKKRELEPGFLDSVRELVKNPPGPGPMSIADPYSDRMKYTQSKFLLRMYGENPNDVFDIPVQVIKLGECLIYAFIGEVFSQFADRLRAASPSKKNLLVSCAHSHENKPYIPIQEMFLPTVYEASLYSATLEPAAGDMMVEKALELAHQLIEN